jgi:molecular chaperone DnaJ
MMQTVKVCDKCHGEGTIIDTPCEKCHGSGFENVSRQITIKIPAGVDTGSVLPLRGEGNAGLKGGRNGDVYVYITVKPHELFRREGNDVYIDVPVTFAQVALGDELRVPTLDGTVKLKVPEGTQSGTTFKIKGKGIQNLGGFGKGNQFVTVNIEVPKKLNEKQKSALREFDKLTPKKVMKRRSIFGKKPKAL